MKVASRKINQDAKRLFEQHIRRFKGDLIIKTGEPSNKAEIYRWNGIRIHVCGVCKSDSLILTRSFIEKQRVRCDLVAVVHTLKETVRYITPEKLYECRTHENDYPDGTNQAKLSEIYKVASFNPPVRKLMGDNVGYGDGSMRTFAKNRLVLRPAKRASGESWIGKILKKGKK